MKRVHVLCAMRDTRVVRQLSKTMDKECAFFATRTGQAALEHAQRIQPDILIVDAVLERIDGIGVVERLRGMLGEQMPRVIGGSVMGFAHDAFARCGVSSTVTLPWDPALLERMIRGLIDDMDARIDWQGLMPSCSRARVLLTEMGVSEHLRGYTYLAQAAALVSADEARLYEIGERVYAPIARLEKTTPQSVERLIRHAIERAADTVGEHGIYAFFGNTIDPMRGKPTNGQMIAMLAQRVKTGRLHDMRLKKNEMGIDCAR